MYRVYYIPHLQTKKFGFVVLNELFRCTELISGGCCYSVAQLCLTLCDPMDAACQASLSFTTSQSLLRLMSIEWVMPYNHLIFCRPLLLLPSIFPSIRVFSNESVLCIRCISSFSFSISPSNECSGLISFRMDSSDLLQSKELSRVFSNITVQNHQFFSIQPSLWSNSHIYTWRLEKA